MEMLIKIIPTSKRAKERIRQHGETMELIKEDAFRGEPAICVKSLDKTSRGYHWHGWFTNKEATFEYE
jgi:hypothetical protein